MSILREAIVCSQCGRYHSIEEFRDGHFCLGCGKFLSTRDRVKTSSVRAQTNVDWPLFPYKPYPQQLDFMRDIKKAVGNRRILVAEACNGFGKTACALASILPLGRKVIYATRTHEQVNQVLLEVEKINQMSQTKFRAVNLAGRQHLCLNDKCGKLSAVEALEACRVLRETGGCSYKIEVESLPNLPFVLSIPMLQREGRARGVCPYFLARRAAEDCAVIVAPYQYVFNERIRLLVNLGLSDKVLVFDEAHNADQVGQEVLSDVLSERGLNSAKRELEVVETSSEFVDELVAFLERKVSSVKAESGSVLYETLKEILKEDDIGSFADSLSGVVDQIRQYKVGRGDNPVCYLNGVLTFLSLVESSPRDSYVAVYKRSLGSNFVEYHCLDPSLAVKPVVEEALGALIMSGTLSPVQLFTEILELEDAEIQSYSAIVDPDNVRTIIDPYVTTRFAERGENMTSRIGERLSRLTAKIPNGILMFFPQRKFMLNALDSWKKKGQIRRGKSHLFLGDKTIFVEGAQAEENRMVVEEYKRAAKTEDGAVLCGVFRGRNAEGSNFPYEEARGVVLIGIPYADYSDPVVKAQIEYYNKKKEGLGEKWYIMDAFRAANQAIGRGIRHRDDWCNFILMDHRYQIHQELISSWALGKGVQKLPSDY
ncbi:MAG: helicase [Thermoproteota archaeon]|nr:helicase [Thermoproteota archaeon]